MVGCAVVTAAAAAPVAAQFGGKATRPQVEPPKGPVRQVIFKNCTSCHGIDDYAYNALDTAGVERAHRRQAQGPERLDFRTRTGTCFSIGWSPNSARIRSHSRARTSLRRSRRFSVTTKRRRSRQGVHVVSWRGSGERGEVQPRSVAGHRARHEATRGQADRRGTGTPGRVAGTHEGDESESVAFRKAGGAGRAGGQEAGKAEAAGAPAASE